MSQIPIGYAKKVLVGFMWSLPMRATDTKSIQGWRLTPEGAQRAIHRAHERREQQENRLRFSVLPDSWSDSSLDGWVDDSE